MEWKKTQRIPFEKRSNQDFRLVRSYRVIILLNRIGKIMQKIMSHHFESYFKLHPNQISGQNEKSAIDEIVTLVQTVQER